MFSTQDTIVAIATPPGRGGLGIIRISGPECQKVSGLILEQAHELQPRHATLTRVRGVDSVIATFFVAPQSYTGEDVVEISAHGSPVVLQAIVQAAQVAGVYGASKRLMERLFVQFENNYPDITFRIVRYGNVLYSTGSVLCIWKDLIEQGNEDTIEILEKFGEDNVHPE